MWAAALVMVVTFATAATLLICIWEVLGLNLGWDTGYPNGDFHGFSQPLRTNSRLITHESSYDWMLYI
jgi:hypothetical protein